MRHQMTPKKLLTNAETSSTSLWERCCIILAAPRNYNTSPSALHKRGQKRQKKSVDNNNGVTDDCDDGFAFTLHRDNSVTIQIPIDFRDEELIQQLKRNVNDFYAMTYTNSVDGIFPTAV